MTRGDGIRDGAVMNPSPGPTASPGNGQKNMASDPTLNLLNPDWNLRRIPGDLLGRSAQELPQVFYFLLMQHSGKERTIFFSSYVEKYLVLRRVIFKAVPLDRQYQDFLEICKKCKSSVIVGAHRIGNAGEQGAVEGSLTVMLRVRV